MKRRRKRSRSNLQGAPSAKDFAVTANILCHHNASAGMIDAFASHYAGQNPRFNRDRFVSASKTCKR
jgi:hypothetical protein